MHAGNNDYPALSMADGTALDSFTLPPFVVITRWLPFWDWVVWAEKIFLNFLYWVKRRTDHLQSKATRDVFTAYDSGELYCALYALTRCAEIWAGSASVTSAPYSYVLGVAPGYPTAAGAG